MQKKTWNIHKYSRESSIEANFFLTRLFALIDDLDHDDWCFWYYFSEILHEAEELWIRQGSDTSSEAGSSTTGGSDISDTASQRSHRSALATVLAKQTGQLHPHHVGPTIITVNGVSASIGGAHNLDSMLYSMDEPRTGPNEASAANNVLFDEAIDLEPIDFEHFVDEPDLDGGQANSERVFKVSFGSSPPMRGR